MVVPVPRCGMYFLPQNQDCNCLILLDNYHYMAKSIHCAKKTHQFKPNGQSLAQLSTIEHNGIRLAV